MSKHRIKILTLKFLVYLKFTCKWVFHIFSGIVFMRLSIPVTFPPFMSLGYSCCPSQEEGVRWPTGDFREGEGAWHRPFVSTSPSLWGRGEAFAPGRCACGSAVLSVPEGTLPRGPRSKLGSSRSSVETSTYLTLGYEASLCSIRKDSSVFKRNFIFNSVSMSGETTLEKK